MISTPIPFQIKVTESEIEKLRDSISSTKLQSTFESIQENSNLGIKLNWLSSIKSVWETKFLDKWQSIELELNELPQFKSIVPHSTNSSLNIHFIHYPSSDRNAIPLLLLHGWPGSVLEFVKLIKLLRTSSSPSYSIVCPSLPGYLYSDSPPLDKEFGIEEVGEVMNNLMIGLGYNQYAIQGGDLGAIAGRLMANKYPKNVKTLHLNFIPAPVVPSNLFDFIKIPSLSNYTIPSLLASFIQTIFAPILPSTSPTTSLDAKDIAAVKKTAQFVKNGRGYSSEHATRPATIGFAIDSNPVALLAWVGEKYVEWTDINPSDDEILTCITLWYLTNTFSTSIYCYRHLTTTPLASPKAYIQQPVGFSSFAKEITPTPRKFAEKTCNLVFYRYHSTGGHFAALEKPEELKKDLDEFFKEVWPKVLGKESKL